MPYNPTAKYGSVWRFLTLQNYSHNRQRNDAYWGVDRTDDRNFQIESFITMRIIYNIF